MNQKHMDWISIEIHMGLNISWRECLVSYTWNWWKPKCGKFFKTYFKIPSVPSTSPNTGGSLFLFPKILFERCGSYFSFTRKELGFNKQDSKWRCPTRLYLLEGGKKLSAPLTQTHFYFQWLPRPCFFPRHFPDPTAEVSKDERTENEILCAKFC